MSAPLPFRRRSHESCRLRLGVAAACAILAGSTAGGAQPEGAGVPRIESIEVTGSIDPPGRLEAYLATLVPPGSFFVQAGEADLVGTPVSTIPRLRAALLRLGYQSVITPRHVPGGVRLTMRLRAHDRLRQIFVRGNWPLRQDEIIRRISVRPGQPLPMAGPEREAFLEGERTRIRDFLRSRGYLDAEIAIELRGKRTVPTPIDMYVKVDRGPGFPLGPVAITGNTAIPSEEIDEALRHSEWFTLWLTPRPFQLSLLREDLLDLTERYRDLGYFGVRLRSDYDALAPEKNVDRQARHVRLGLTVNERKRIELVFEGNASRSDGDLRDVLTLAKRGAYDDFEAEASAAAIAAHYRDRGHMLAKVAWRRERVEPQVDRLVFTIDEGPKLKVRQVAFVGNRSLPADELEGVVATQVFPFVGFLGIGEGGYTSVRQLELDTTDRLPAFYQARGFPDVVVRCEIAPWPGAWRPAHVPTASEEIEWRRSGSIYVRFTIDEGQRVSVDRITFEVTDPGAILPRDEAYFRGSLLSAVGAPYFPPLVRQDAERLRRLFGDEGYPGTSVEPEVTRDGAAVSILWRVALGPRVTVGPVFTRGNFLTREKTILAWVPLRTGEVLTTTGLERGQRNLALTQLFNNPSPLSFPSDAAPDASLAPMLIEVEERHDHWGVLHLGVGASTEQVTPGSSFPVGGFVSAGYEHRNLLGRGWGFLSEGVVGNSLVRAGATLQDPRLLGTPFRLQIDGSYLRQETVRLGDIRSGAGSIGLSRELYPGVDATVRYNLRDTFRTEFLLRGAGADEQQSTVRLGTLIGSLSFHLTWQRIDNILLPTQGFRLAGNVELADPAFTLARGRDAFVKVGASSLSVVGLTRALSLRHSLRFDQGFPLGGAVLLPKVERYFAGGDTTLRGFDLDRARTEVTRIDLAGGQQFQVEYRPLGGNLRVLHNVDLQFPCGVLPWHCAVFFDSGIVADSFDGMQPARFRHAIGVSPLLIRLPIGDISLSWAWPLDPGPGDSAFGRLHFNVGLMF